MTRIGPFLPIQSPLEAGRARVTTGTGVSQGTPVTQGTPQQKTALGPLLHGIGQTPGLLGPLPGVQGGTGELKPALGPGAPKGPNPPKGGTNGTEAARTPLGPAAVGQAQRALTREVTPDANHPYVQLKSETRSQLDRLGALGKGGDRIHVSDTAWAHGEEVVRTAAGKTSLAQGAQTSMSFAGVPESFAKANMSAGELQRLDQAKNFNPHAPGVGTDDLARTAVNGMSQDLVDKRLRLQQLREQLPNPTDGKKTFVNMSFGSTPEEASDRMMKDILTAPKGSTLRKEMTDLLGHEPAIEDDGKGGKRFNRDDMRKLKTELVHPKLKAAMGSKDGTAVLDGARQGLENELAEGRKSGVLVFAAAGNARVNAEKAGDVEMSRALHSGVKGLINVGATDIGDPSKSSDDRVAKFSSGGNIDISAPGVKMPVGVGLGKDGKPIATDREGTSFAAPHAVETAYAMSSANPNLSADDIARLIQDPRALRDVPGTKLDGAGQIDQFSAVLLAKNPNLTRQQIDQARAGLADPNADAARIRANLGID